MALAPGGRYLAWEDFSIENQSSTLKARDLTTSKDVGEGDVGSLGTATVTVSPDPPQAGYPGGTLNLRGAGSPVPLAGLVIDGGTVNDGDTLTVSGALTGTASGGFFNGSGSVSVAGSTTLSGDVTLSGISLINSGAAAWTAGTISFAQGASFTNTATGTPTPTNTATSTPTPTNTATSTTTSTATSTPTPTNTARTGRPTPPAQSSRKTVARLPASEREPAAVVRRR